MPAPRSVDDYLAPLPNDQRAALQHLREVIAAAAPEATETIAYGMPAFRLEGRFLVSYAAYKKHLSLYPYGDAVLEATGDALKPYLAGKGTIRFKAEDPLPDDLIGKIVQARVAEVGRRVNRG